MSATVLMRFVRVACAGGLALTAAVSAQTVTPANSTDQQALQHGIELSVVRNTEDGAMVPISHVVPLTARAAEDLEVRLLRLLPPSSDMIHLHRPSRNSHP